MVEGYMTYQSMMYIIEYLSQLAYDIYVLLLWMLIPPTNLKGRFWWGNVDGEK
jgi:hypothetical protein